MTRAELPDGAKASSPYLHLSIAVAFVSLGSILVRLAQAPPLAVSFYRVFIAAVVLAPFALLSAIRSWPTLSREKAALLLCAGLALGAHFATWVTSLSYTSVASSVLLVNTAPLFTVVFSRAFLGERVSATVRVAMALAVAGACVIALGDWGSGAASLKGDLLALAGAVALSLYHVIGRGLRETLPLNAYILGVWIVAALVLVLSTLSLGVSLVGYPPRTYGIFLALGLLPTLAGHGLVNLVLRSLPAPTVGLFLLGEPIGAALLAFFIFGERPGPWVLAGGAVVLAALAMVVLKEPA
jgi:drug/metabolite transporter (DMT)-like permease